MISYVPEYLKINNRKQVFDLFVKYQRLSKVDVASMTEMSFPTASKAVDFLLSKNIIRECGPEKSVDQKAGRKRTVMQFNPSAYCCMAANFEGGFVEMGLVDLAGKVHDAEVIDFVDFLNPESQRQLGKRMRQKMDTAFGQVLGIGMGLPMDVNPDTGQILSFWNGQQKVPVRFQELFGAMLEEVKEAVYVSNDVNLACRGEGKGRTQKGESLCYLTLGSGFGAGLMLAGELWPGSRCRAGEIGNSLLSLADVTAGELKQPEPLEERINIRAIDSQFGIHLRDNPELDNEKRTEIVEFLLPVMTMAVCNMVFVLDVEQFVLDGFIPTFFGDELREKLENRANQILKWKQNSVRILPPMLQYSALVGAADLVFEKTILQELDT